MTRTIEEFKKLNPMKLIVNCLCFCLLITFSSCISHFEEYNTHPTDPNPDDMTVAERVGILFPEMLYLMHNQQENLSQCIEQMIGNQYGGYMSTTNKWNNNNFGTFNPIADWVAQPFVRTFPKFYGNYLQVKKITESKGYIYAWANIIRAAVMLRMTDIYGPIPYSNVGGIQLSAEYNSVRSAYHNMIDDLTSSVDTLKVFVAKNGGKINPMAEYDPVYNGNFSKWIKFANSLKLRMAVRIGLVDTDYAIGVMNSAIVEGIINTKDKESIILSNEDNAFLPSIDNPYYKAAFDWHDLAVSATLSAYMNGWRDPRRQVYMTLTSDDTYRGVRMGIDNIEKDVYGGDLYSKPNFKSTSPLPVYCAAETYFLLAEATLRGWISVNLDVRYLYLVGVTTSMQQHNVTIGSYMSVTEDPEYYEDPNDASLSFDISEDAAGEHVTVSWERANTFEKKLEAIITQKWLANYPLGFEAWCDFRRTGYPRLMPAASNLSSVEDIGGVVNNTTTIDPNILRMARRLPYPVSEYNDNSGHVQNAVNNFLDGRDEFSTELWWGKGNQ